MTKILAAIDASAAAGPVLAAARGVARLYDAGVEAVHVHDEGHGSAETARAAAERAGVPLRTFSGAPMATLVAIAQDDEVAAIVLGSRAAPVGKPVGHVTVEVITSLRKPVVVVPPWVPRRSGFERVLVPLEGTRASAAALTGVIERACSHGLEVVLLYVREEASVPRFSEQPQHEMAAWTEEFLARNCSRPPGDVRLEVRVGSAGEEIARVIERTRSDLLALSWSQVLAPDRARVVRRSLEESKVPVLLVPDDGRRPPA